MLSCAIAGAPRAAVTAPERSERRTALRPREGTMGVLAFMREHP